ncbi:TPA: hypothetical protein QHO11_000040 [Klebsiella oxytoca]|nr:hypothetical protein [Klebsiella oxytoca]
MDNDFFNFTLPSGIDVDLRDYLSPLKIKDGDVVIASGTLVEGIGNEFSDIDIYIITDKLRNTQEIDISGFFRVISPEKEILKNDSEQDILLVHLPVEKTGVKVDVEFKTFDDVNQISHTLLSNYKYAVKNHILLTKEMPERHLSFMHRIHNSVCLFNNEGLSDIQGKFPVDVINYYLYRLNASDFADLLDIIGAWNKNEISRCFDLARENLIKQMLAYICLVGNTDYKRKWLLTRMKQVGINQDLYDRFLILFLRSKIMSDKEYIVETIRMVDEIYSLSALFFSETKNNVMPTAQNVLSWLDHERNNCDKEYEKAEVDYRCKAYDISSLWSTVELLERSLI